MDVSHTKDSLPEEMVFPSHGEEMELTMAKLKIKETEDADNLDFPTEEEVANSKEMEEIRSNVATVSNSDMSNSSVLSDLKRTHLALMKKVYHILQIRKEKFTLTNSKMKKGPVLLESESEQSATIPTQIRIL